jgi:hypothetical protein
VDLAKVTTPSTTVPAAPPLLETKTPARHRLTEQPSRQKDHGPSFFSTATTPSPRTNTALPTATAPQQQQQQHFRPCSSTAVTPAPFKVPSFVSAQKSPPGTSQVLRKHFQNLGFATPLKHQRLLASGAVRLTPTSRKTPKGADMASKRIGFDGTMQTPSKELLKSTASSRNQRIVGLQDVSLDVAEDKDYDSDEEDDSTTSEQQPHFCLMPPVPESAMAAMDDESSTVTEITTTDDASFDMSLAGINPNNNSILSNILPAPHSPLMPRMGCHNPVALTLLNDGKEDYSYLLAQDSLYSSIPKVVEDTSTSMELAGLPCKDSASSSSSTSPYCLSPTFGDKSPAEVRATLSQKVRSTLARPVAILPKRSGRISPSQAHPPRLLMRPQPKHVR